MFDIRHERLFKICASFGRFFRELPCVETTGEGCRTRRNTLTIKANVSKFGHWFLILCHPFPQIILFDPASSGRM